MAPEKFFWMYPWVDLEFVPEKNCAPSERVAFFLLRARRALQGFGAQPPEFFVKFSEATIKSTMMK